MGLEMVLESAINKLLRDVVNLLLASPGYTIKAKQKGAPRPSVPYADIDFISDNRVGWEQRTFEDNSGDSDLTETITGMREIMMSVSFYRDEAIDNARKVRIGLIRESIQELFSASGLAYTRASEVREISEPFQHGWEERSQFDIVLSAVGTDADIVNSILSVDMSAVYQFRGLIYNSNIEVQ